MIERQNFSLQKRGHRVFHRFILDALSERQQRRSDLDNYPRTTFITNMAAGRNKKRCTYFCDSIIKPCAGGCYLQVSPIYALSGPAFLGGSPVFFVALLASSN